MAPCCGPDTFRLQSFRPLSFTQHQEVDGRATEECTARGIRSLLKPKTTAKSMMSLLKLKIVQLKSYCAEDCTAKIIRFVVVAETKETKAKSTRSWPKPKTAQLKNILSLRKP